MLEMNDYEGAREQFAELVEVNEEIIHFYTGLAQAQMGLGDRQAAFATYEQAIHLFPRNVPLTVRYSEALVQYGDPGLAHEVLLDLLNQVPPTPEQVRLIAIAANAAGDTADAHYYMAEYHLLNGDLRMAVDQLRLALGIPGLESVQRARFLARLEQLQENMPSQARQRGQSRD
jgi:predicted Zn-dependent protease